MRRSGEVRINYYVDQTTSFYRLSNVRRLPGTSVSEWDRKYIRTYVQHMSLIKVSMIFYGKCHTIYTTRHDIHKSKSNIILSHYSFLLLLPVSSLNNYAYLCVLSNFCFELRNCWLPSLVVLDIVWNSSKLGIVLILFFILKAWNLLILWFVGNCDWRIDFT